MAFEAMCQTPLAYWWCKMWQNRKYLLFYVISISSLLVAQWHRSGTERGAVIFCSKTCLATVFVRFLRGKKHARFSASAVFPVQNRTNWHNSRIYFALIPHLLSIQTTKSWKMFMNNQFKAKRLNRKTAGNSRCHILASRALNLSGTNQCAR